MARFFLIELPGVIGYTLSRHISSAHGQRTFYEFQFLRVYHLLRPGCGHLFPSFASTTERLSADCQLGVLRLVGLSISEPDSDLIRCGLHLWSEVYRKNIVATPNLVDFMLYVSFFPQLVAGPIERATHLLPQISGDRKPDAEDILSGMQLAAVGFFKKMVIADNLAVIVDEAYRQPEPAGTAVLVAT